MRKGKDATGKPTLKGIPFVVPGARFNELYNWDSYFSGFSEESRGGDTR